MYLYRVTDALHAQQRGGQFFECDCCGHRFPDVEVFKSIFGIMPHYIDSLQKTIESVLTLFNECTPERYEDNGELRFCTYCGAPFYHVVDVYQEWTRTYRMAGDEKWYNEEQFGERAADVEEESRGEYRRWLAERMEENK